MFLNKIRLQRQNGGCMDKEKTIDYALTVRNIRAEGRRIHKRMKSNKRKMEKRTYNFEESLVSLI